MNVPNPIPNEGFSISPRASFTIVKALPLLGVAKNNFNPKLILFPDGVEYRVLRTRRRRYEEIESVDALQALGTQNVILRWRDSFFAFGANLGKEDSLIALLRFFRDRGNSLGERALKLLGARAMS